MKLYVKTTGCGIFSNFYVAIRNIEAKIKSIDSIESIYLESEHNTKIYQKCQGFNPFDFVLDQKIENWNVKIESEVFTIDEILSDLNYEYIYRMKKICHKIRIKESILALINPLINKKTLGVHVRLTDMLQYHPEYISNSGHDTKSYIDKSSELIKQNDKIFVSSDNKQSLIKFKEKFNIISNDSRNLSDEEHSKNYFEYKNDNLDKEWLWHDSFLDMISLSKCGSLIYNVSSLNTTSFLYSNSMMNTYRIGF